MFFEKKQNLLEKFISKDKEQQLSGIFFELTKKCNLKCKHCRVARDTTKKELSYGEICNIIDQIAEFGCFYIDFTGGEPLMRRDFFDIATYVRRKKLALVIHTNGALITPSVADKIADLHPLEVYLPFLGLKKDTDDRLRGEMRGVHKKVVRAVRLLEERGVRTRLTLVVMKQNADEMRNAKEFVQRSGASSWYFLPDILPRTDGSLFPLICRASNHQIEYIERLGWEERKDTVLSVSKSNILNNSVCTAGRQATIVTAYGDLNPCIWLPNKNSDCNLKKKSFSQIWKHNPEFKRLRSLKKKDLPVCRDCELLRYCFPCPALSFFEKGDITLPSSECCRLAKIRKNIL